MSTSKLQAPKSQEEKRSKLSWQRLRKLSDLELVQYVLDRDKVIDGCLCYPKEFVVRFFKKEWFQGYCFQAFLSSPVYGQREILQEVIDGYKKNSTNSIAKSREDAS